MRPPLGEGAKRLRGNTLPPVSLFKAASTVSLLTLASRITGLVRELLMASVFGVSAMTDAFNVAFRIPNLFRRVLGEGAFSQAFVPVLSATRAQEGEESARALIDHVGTLLAWTLVLLCIAGVLGAPWMVWGMASGLKQSPQGFDAAVTMTRWMFPYIGFMSLVALAGGILNTWKKFAVPAASPVLLNIALILSITLGAPLFARYGIEPIYAQAAGVMLGGLLQLAIQVPALVRLGLLPRIGVRWAAIRAAWSDPTTRKVARLMLPALLGVSVAQISLLINTQIASHLPTGSVSWITYADRLMELPTALLGVALGVVLMPQLASARAKQDDDQYSAMLDWGLPFGYRIDWRLETTQGQARLWMKVYSGDRVIPGSAVVEDNIHWLLLSQIAASDGAVRLERSLASDGVELVALFRRTVQVAEEEAKVAAAQDTPPDSVFKSVSGAYVVVVSSDAALRNDAVSTLRRLGMSVDGVVDVAQARDALQGHVANLLVVHDQALFIRQLEEILRALDTDLEIRLAPLIGKGNRVVVNIPLSTPSHNFD